MISTAMSGKRKLLPTGCGECFIAENDVSIHVDPALCKPPEADGLRLEMVDRCRDVPSG
jgi:hypothetical protein